jgi:hypothetical protein
MEGLLLLRLPSLGLPSFGLLATELIDELADVL